MIPTVFSSPVPIASHQVKQAQQGQSSNQGNNSSSSQSQQSSSTTSKVVDPTTAHCQPSSAEMNVPVNAETEQHPNPGGYGPMQAEGSFMGVSSGSSGQQYGSGVGDYDHSVPFFHASQQQQSFQPGSQQQQQSVNMGQQQMYLSTPEMQQGRHSQPPPTSSPYLERRPQDDLQRSNSH